MTPRFVFWDIDGTLLTTGRAGIFAWERALREEFDIYADLSEMRTSGLTDTEIALSLARRFRDDATPTKVSSLLARYGDHLPTCLPLRQGRVLDGVLGVLERLKREASVRSYLLTGNTRAGAAAKLGHYGLARYFAKGFFADGCVQRAAIAHQAAVEARRESGTADPMLFVVGDTPHDIACGKAIGARTISVATGEYSLDQLRRHGPYVVLPNLPDPESFVKLISSAA
jgi:phosphoglycolate phosphatase